MDETTALLRELTSAVEAGEPVALATVVDTRRSVPRHAGSKMLVRADGRFTGTVGGGETEARVVAEALEAIADGEGRLVHYELRDPASGDPGMCGGEMTVYVEPFVPAPTVFVVGCGHVGRAVVELAHWLGFRVTATDDRAELVTEAELPDADVLAPGPIGAVLLEAPITAETHVVVVTRGVEVDADLLPILLATPARSIGVIGSHRRWRATRRALLERGITEQDIERIDNPIGLDIGAETPREIALAILGEIVELRRRGKSPTRLRG